VRQMTMAFFGRHVSKLSGYAPAIPTPFDDNGDVDGAAFDYFCDRQIQVGATALVVGQDTRAPFPPNFISAAEVRQGSRETKLPMTA
jgi:hypothetical protein